MAENTPKNQEVTPLSKQPFLAEQVIVDIYRLDDGTPHHVEWAIIAGDTRKVGSAQYWRVSIGDITRALGLIDAGWERLRRNGKGGGGGVALVDTVTCDRCREARNTDEITDAGAGAFCPDCRRKIKFDRVIARAEARIRFYYNLYNQFRVKRDEYSGVSEGKALYQKIHTEILREVGNAQRRMEKRRDALIAARDGKPLPSRRVLGEAVISEAAKNGWATRRMKVSQAESQVVGRHAGRTARRHIPQPGAKPKRRRPLVEVAPDEELPV